MSEFAGCSVRTLRSRLRHWRAELRDGNEAARDRITDLEAELDRREAMAAHRNDAAVS